jgi:phosphatidate cytidylyltransferase
MAGTAGEGGNAVPAQRGELLTRIVSAAILAIVALIAAVLGGGAAAFVLGIVTAVVHLEWVSLTDRSPWPAAVFTAGLVVAISLITVGAVTGGLIIVGLAVVAAGLTGSVWRPLGVVYASALGIGLLLLRLAPDQGLAAVIVLLTTVWATDTGAFFAGRIAGGAKLWPTVSPNKTWAGAIGGLAAGLVCGLLVADFLKIMVGVELVAVVAALSVASQGGDLFESWVKRRFGAKDAGQLVPGHGGLMDRVDGLTFATGVAVLIGWLHAGPDLGRGLLQW